MKKKDILLDYLKKQDSEFVAGRDLAKMLAVTERSVRYYVKQLNEERQQIETSRAGYRYHHLPKNERSTVESVLGRRFGILRRLLRAEDEGLDLFDLAAELYVSEGTIRSDMAALQDLAQSQQLAIEQRGFRYFLMGEQAGKRALMIEMIRKGNEGAPSLAKELQRFLGEIPLSALFDKCRAIFAAFDFQANHYFFQNFVLHVTLALNQCLEREQPEFSSPSLAMVEALAIWLEKDYGQSLGTADKYELALLCDGERRHTAFKHPVQPEVERALTRALRELSEVYLLDFTAEKFVTRLLGHTQNLYQRAQGARVKRNLSVLDIKMRYPVLFDIAVYLAALIAGDLEIEIAEDEIAFLTLHIGAFLEEQQRNAMKVRLFLLTSGYLKGTERLQAALARRFDEEIVFVSDLTEAELVIVTENISVKFDRVLRVREFLTEQDFLAVQREIVAVKQARYLGFLQELLPRLIGQEACLELAQPFSKNEIFDFIGTWFEARGYVEADFTQQLLLREKMASTAFTSGVAIPHTIRYDAKKTGLLVLKPPRGFMWDNQEVTLILALAVCRADSQNFNQIFPRIIEVLVEPYQVIYLGNSSTHTEFIARLIELMTADGYYDE